MFYVVCKNIEERSNLISYLKDNNIMAIFHYLSLHKSEFYKNKHDGRELLNSDYYTDCLVRLPMCFELTNTTVHFITNHIIKYYGK